MDRNVRWLMFVVRFSSWLESLSFFLVCCRSLYVDRIVRVIMNTVRLYVLSKLCDVSRAGASGCSGSAKGQGPSRQRVLADVGSAASLVRPLSRAERATARVSRSLTRPFMVRMHSITAGTVLTAVVLWAMSYVQRYSVMIHCSRMLFSCPLVITEAW